MKIIFIIGEPLTGKSTLMKNFVESKGAWTHKKLGKCKLMHHKGSKLFIIGHYYEGQKFGGTDTLAMDAITDCERFVNALHGRKDGSCVILEGDRLLNKRFLDFCLKKKNAQLILIKLTTGQASKDHRQALRGTLQSESFKKGRKTKIENIVSAYKVTEFENETEEQFETILNFMKEEAGSVARHKIK